MNSDKSISINDLPPELTINDILELAHGRLKKRRVQNWFSTSRVEPVDPDKKPHKFTRSDVYAVLKQKNRLGKFFTVNENYYFKKVLKEDIDRAISNTELSEEGYKYNPEAYAYSLNFDRLLNELVNKKIQEFTLLQILDEVSRGKTHFDKQKLIDDLKIQVQLILDGSSNYAAQDQVDAGALNRLENYKNYFKHV